MTTRKTSPAKKEFCVWADYVRRVYQHVTAETPQQAHDLAKKRVECWDACDSHESNGFRLSNDVQDLESGEFIAIHGTSSCSTCGSDIVGTVNGSNFCEGECGPCEYQRYKSQPDLLSACEAVCGMIYRDKNNVERIDLDLYEQKERDCRKAITNAYGTSK